MKMNIIILMVFLFSTAAANAAWTVAEAAYNVRSDQNNVTHAYYFNSSDFPNRLLSCPQSTCTIGFGILGSSPLWISTAGDSNTNRVSYSNGETAQEVYSRLSMRLPTSQSRGAKIAVRADSGRPVPPGHCVGLMTFQGPGSTPGVLEPGGSCVPIYSGANGCAISGSVGISALQPLVFSHPNISIQSGPSTVTRSVTLNCNAVLTARIKLGNPLVSERNIRTHLSINGQVITENGVAFNFVGGSNPLNITSTVSEAYVPGFYVMNAVLYFDYL